MATSAASAASESTTERTVATATRHQAGGRCEGRKSMRAQARARSTRPEEVAMTPRLRNGAAPPGHP